MSLLNFDSIGYVRCYWWLILKVCEISSFRRKIGEKCALLCYWAVCSGISYRRFGTTCQSSIQISRVDTECNFTIRAV